MEFLKSNPKPIPITVIKEKELLNLTLKDSIQINFNNNKMIDLGPEVISNQFLSDFKQNKSQNKTDTSTLMSKSSGAYRNKIGDDYLLSNGTNSNTKNSSTLKLGSSLAFTNEEKSNQNLKSISEVIEENEIKEEIIEKGLREESKNTIESYRNIVERVKKGSSKTLVLLKRKKKFYISNIYNFETVILGEPIVKEIIEKKNLLEIDRKEKKHRNTINKMIEINTEDNLIEESDKFKFFVSKIFEEFGKFYFVYYCLIRKSFTQILLNSYNKIPSKNHSIGNKFN